MTSEDLFLAIGQVEGSKLLRSELTLQGPSNGYKEGPEMKKTSVRMGRILRNVMVAAIILSMLGVTAYAAVYLIFDSPEDMISTIFGDKTGYDHLARGKILDKDGNLLAEQYAHHRVPADEAVVAQEAAPLVEPVGQSISWNDYTLTVDANLYDYATKCVVLTYILENSKGLDYDVESNGSVWFPGGEILDFGQYGYSYIIRDQSTNTKLTASYYYQLRNPESSNLEIGFTQWASTTQEEIDRNIEEIKQALRKELSEDEALAFQKEYVGDSWPWFEENRTREENIDAGYEALAYGRLEETETCPELIVVSENVQSKMSAVTAGHGVVRISPIAITVKMEEIADFPNSYLGLTKIVFADGGEYLVKNTATENFVFAVADPETEETTFMFNRIIDVKNVVSVIVDGNIELPVD